MDVAGGLGPILAATDVVPIISNFWKDLQSRSDVLGTNYTEKEFFHKQSNSRKDWQQEGLSPLGSFDLTMPIWKGSL